jgi:transporter family protein
MAVSIIFALLAALTWGVAPMFEKWSVLRTSPFMALFVQGIVVIGVLLVFGTWRGEFRKVPPISKESWVVLIIAGLLSGLIAQFFYYLSLRTGNVTQVIPLITSLQLVISSVLAVLFLHEPLSVAKAAGIFMIIAGIYLVS